MAYSLSWVGHLRHWPWSPFSLPGFSSSRFLGSPSTCGWWSWHCSPMASSISFTPISYRTLVCRHGGRCSAWPTTSARQDIWRGFSFVQRDLSKPDHLTANSSVMQAGTFWSYRFLNFARFHLLCYSHGTSRQSINGFWHSCIEKQRGDLPC